MGTWGRRLLWLLWWLPLVVWAAGPDVPLRDLDGKERNANEFIGKGK